MKNLLLAVFVLTMAVEASGQTAGAAAAEPECKLTVKQSPAIRGIRLGMTLEEVLALFPGIREEDYTKSNGRFGLSFASLTPSNPASRERLTGINKVSLTLLDDRVSSVHVYYDGPPWRDVDQFVSRLSDPLKLPEAEKWEQRGSNGRVVKCQGFEVAVHADTSGLNNTLQIFMPVDNILKQREEVEKEKKRQAFKP